MHLVAVQRWGSSPVWLEKTRENTLQLESRDKVGNNTSLDLVYCKSPQYIGLLGNVSKDSGTRFATNSAKCLPWEGGTLCSPLS